MDVRVEVVEQKDVLHHLSGAGFGPESSEQTEGVQLLLCVREELRTLTGGLPGPLSVLEHSTLPSFPGIPGESCPTLSSRLVLVGTGCSVSLHPD